MKAKEKPTEAEAQAREFIRENEPLLNDGGESTVGHIITQGSEIVVALSGEAVEAANELTNVKNLLADAISDPKTPPKRVHILEMQEKRLQKEYDRKNAEFERFAAFLERAHARYEKCASGVEPASPEPDVASDEDKRGFFARLFGRA